MIQPAGWEVAFMITMNAATCRGNIEFSLRILIGVWMRSVTPRLLILIYAFKRATREAHQGRLMAWPSDTWTVITFTYGG